MLKETTFQHIISEYNEYSKTIQWNKEPQLLYEPLQYTMTQEGKKIRPLALLLSYSIFHQDISPAMEAAYGLELFHNFTLLHDDIMDQALTRRGKPTAHVQFGENRALLSGDAMLIESCRYFVKYSEKSPSLISFFLSIGIEVCEGQSFDMAFETKELITLVDYLKMIKLKTSVLLGAALKMGAMIATDDQAMWEEMYNLGITLGIAFQIQDDYLDLYGDEVMFGKKHGGDLIQKKKTILILATLEKMPIEERLNCIRHYNVQRPDADQIDEFKRLFDQYNIQIDIQSLYNKYKDECINTINKMNISTENQQKLTKFVHMVLGRKY